MFAMCWGWSQYILTGTSSHTAVSDFRVWNMITDEHFPGNKGKLYDVQNPTKENFTSNIVTILGKRPQHFCVHQINFVFINFSPQKWMKWKFEKSMNILQFWLVNFVFDEDQISLGYSQSKNKVWMLQYRHITVIFHPIKSVKIEMYVCQSWVIWLATYQNIHLIIALHCSAGESTIGLKCESIIEWVFKKLVQSECWKTFVW